MVKNGKNGNGAGTTAIVPVKDYPIVVRSPKEVAAIIQANAGPAGLSDRDFDQLTVPGGGGLAWEVQGLDGVEYQKEVVGVVVQFKDVKLCWKAGFEESGGSPPDCISSNCIDGIGNPGGKCAICPLAEFGSDPKGGRGKACKDNRLLLMATPSGLLPIIVKLPPTSLRACRNYFITRLSGSGYIYYEVVTRLTLAKDTNKDGIEYSTVEFHCDGPLSKEDREKFRAFNESLSSLMECMQATEAA